MGKPNGLSKRSGEEKFGMDAHFLNKGHLLEFKNDNVGEEENVDHVELDRINVVIWEQKNRVCIVLQEHRLEVLH